MSYISYLHKVSVLELKHLPVSKKIITMNNDFQYSMGTSLSKDRSMVKLSLRTDQ